MNFKIKNIKIDKSVVAKVFKFTKKKTPKIKFFTSKNLNLQVGIMGHSKSHKIIPHFHINKKKKINNMSEFLIIFKGQLKVNFYNKKKILKKSEILKARDMILLLKGGHGFEVLQELDMIEIKQGPYYGDKDKIRF